MTGLLAVALTACSVPDVETPDERPAPTEVSLPPNTDPSVAGLLGDWVVSDDSGEVAALGLSNQGLVADSPECTFYGNWATLDGFLATTVEDSEGADCPSEGSPAWLSETTRVEADGDGWALLDKEASVVVRLTPSTSPPPPNTLEIPDDRTPAMLSSSQGGLPASFVIGLPEGTWTPVSDRVVGTVTVDETSWSIASDECEYRGQWLKSSRGRVLTGPQPATLDLASCNATPASWFFAARLVGFQSHAMVLFDSAGEELGRLNRVG